MTRRDLVAASAGLLAAVAVAACGDVTSTDSNANVGVCGTQAGSASGRTAGYVVVLVADRLSGSRGGAAASPGSSAAPTPVPDVVVSGSVADVSGPGATHIAVHICHQSSGAVVTGVHPRITLRNVTKGTSPEALAVAVVEGRGQGVNDLGYGNNVLLDPGDAYTVSVRIDPSNSIDLTYDAPEVLGPMSPQSALNLCLQNHQMC